MYETCSKLGARKTTNAVVEPTVGFIVLSDVSSLLTNTHLFSYAQVSWFYDELVEHTMKFTFKLLTAGIVIPLLAIAINLSASHGLQHTIKDESMFGPAEACNDFRFSEGTQASNQSGPIPSPVTTHCYLYSCHENMDCKTQSSYSCNRCSVNDPNRKRFGECSAGQ